MLAVIMRPETFVKMQTASGATDRLLKGPYSCHKPPCIFQVKLECQIETALKTLSSVLLAVLYVTPVLALDRDSCNADIISLLGNGPSDDIFFRDGHKIFS